MSNKKKEKLFFNLRVSFITFAIGFISLFLFKLVSIFLKIEDLKLNYRKSQVGKTYLTLLGREKIFTEEMCDNKVLISYFSLMILFIFLCLLFFIFNYYFYQFYLYCTCSKEIKGTVYPDRFHYWLSYKYKKGKEYKNRADYNQKTYRKIYFNYDGEAILFINPLKPDKYIIGSKAKFFNDRFFMPCIMDLLLIVAAIGCCFLFNPLFILNL